MHACEQKQTKTAGTVAPLTFLMIPLLNNNHLSYKNPARGSVFQKLRNKMNLGAKNKV